MSERLARWRMVLGGGEGDGVRVALDERALAMDRVLAALYSGDGSPSKRGGLGASAPNAARWLADIREFFPSSVVRVMQQDAIERLNMRRLLLEPEMLREVEPDVHLVAELVALSGVIPAKAKATAREVVGKVVSELLRRLDAPMKQAIAGALRRSVRNRRPRLREIDWNRTIRANLRHYQAEHNTIVPETRIGFGRKRSSMKDVILCIDQSGSMGTSVVYSGVFAAVLASIPAIRTRVVAFDTSVTDLSDLIADPVELLFGVQLGGGTDIHGALTYCQGLVTRPSDTVLVLISDLIEGPDPKKMLRKAQEMIESGVQVVTLLALSDDGKPSFDREAAAILASMGSPAFACTPDVFPELMAAALQRQDIGRWAGERGIAVERGRGE